MNIIDLPKKCVGCGACVDVCPAKALRLARNENGFHEPEFANDVCVNCGKCTGICPALNVAKRDFDPSFYYGWNTDEAVRKKSSSGGMFSVLADRVLREGGVVVGARYADDFRSVVMSSTEECDLDELRRSKYCQSFPDGIYGKVSRFLKDGKKVMMVGTPCQIAAARRIFGENQNLFLVDFLCGGVTPNTAFSDYIDDLEKKYRSKIVNLNMRDKKAGWSKPMIRVEFANGKVYTSRYQFDYYYHYYYCTPFLKNDPCLTCSFTAHPDADLTIADFWGYQAANVAKDEKGISLIGVYTEKGKAMLEAVSEHSVLYPLTAAQTAYAYREKCYSKENLEERNRVLATMRDTSFIQMAKRHRFRHGKIGILSKILLRKVLHK